MFNILTHEFPPIEEVNVFLNLNGWVEEGGSNTYTWTQPDRPSFFCCTLYAYLRAIGIDAGNIPESQFLEVFNRLKTVGWNPVGSL